MQDTNRENLSQKRSHGEWIKKVFLTCLGIGFAVLLSLPYFLFRDKIQEAPAWGYTGVLLGCALSNASLFLPTSSTILVLSASAVLNPFLCVLIGGTGAAVGEQVSYICGRIGLSWIEHDTEKEGKVLTWLNKNSMLTVFLFAFLPLPLFDVAGLAAGAAGMRWDRFAIAAAAGKILKFAITAAFVFYLAPLYLELLPENIRVLYESLLAGLK